VFKTWRYELVVEEDRARNCAAAIDREGMTPSGGVSVGPTVDGFTSLYVYIDVRSAFTARATLRKLDAEVVAIARAFDGNVVRQPEVLLWPARLS
jgi:hypothetical protein